MRSTVEDRGLPAPPSHGRRGRRWYLYALVAGAFVVLGVLPALGYRASRIRVVEGVTTHVTEDQSAITIGDASGKARDTWDTRALGEWRDTTGQWMPVGRHIDRGVPECIPAYSWGARVELGIVKTPSVDGHGGGDVVVWLKCISSPTGRS